MRLSDIIDRLKVNELSDLFIGSEAFTENKEKLVNNINSALLTLYTRFNLRENHLLLEQQEHITNYHLIYKYAESSKSNVPFPYIKDMINDPFQEDVIKILRVVDIKQRNVPLNDINHPRSVFTPQVNVLNIPYPETGVPLSVIYQAKHHKIYHTGEDDNTLLAQEIELPFFLEEALTSYVAYKVYFHMNGIENQNKATNFLVLFNDICDGVTLNDLAAQSDHTSSTVFTTRGYV